ncbi:MAG: hypothetical protein ACOC0U_07190 [Desulfovibrionales bacterium]
MSKVLRYLPAIRNIFLRIGESHHPYRVISLCDPENRVVHWK